VAERAGEVGDQVGRDAEEGEAAGDLHHCSQPARQPEDELVIN
jgi:hypothetical protein